MSEWQWFGQAGHFCAANACRFHVHTHIGRWCVSTVGDYYPGGIGSTSPEEIGHGRTFETMVFELGADGETDGHDIDFAAYDDRDAANAGHLEMCRKWAAK